MCIALVFAQVYVRALASEGAKTSLLIDDASADLDVDNLGTLYSVLKNLPAQLVVSAIDERALHHLSIGKTFHVKQATITRML